MTTLINENDKKPLVLVTGSNGQVGSELQQLQAQYPLFEFHFADRTTLDITNEDAVMHYFQENKPAFCINAAAYTAVDKAESEKELAFLNNCDAVGYLAKACFANQTYLIHYSTDYVFDGLATSPYIETDATNPTGVYAASKLAGEERINAIANELSVFNYLIIRTSWVYSSFGNNFVKTMLRLMKDRPQLKVVNDQIGCPTYAADLAKTTLELLVKIHSKERALQKAVFHYSNEGICSWYDFACKIGTLSGYTGEVTPISTAEYPTPAKRPAYSVFDKSLIKQETGISIPSWENALERCLKLLVIA
jgi:dTDP-4-dehydrorhamnose reductase